MRRWSIADVGGDVRLSEQGYFGCLGADLAGVCGLKSVS
jgi:hypothetical protein